MTQKLHIDYITFEESTKIVSYAPQLELCFDATTPESSLESLKMGTMALLNFWKEKNMLEDKISTLGLNGKTTPEEREKIQRKISVPYFILLKKEKTEGRFDITV